MIQLAHVINPVKVDKNRDLYYQQPMVFESIRTARLMCMGVKDFSVMNYLVGYEEDKEIYPQDDLFHDAGLLTKHTLGRNFKVPRKLPYFAEIIEKCYEAAPYATHIIQTNADIILYPHFYLLVKYLIEEGNNTFCINKRIMPEYLNKIKDLPVLWSLTGNPHNGHDCFVFKRDAWPKMDLGDVCMGTPWSEGTIIASMVSTDPSFKVYKTANATFHIGDNRTWLKQELNDYRFHNANETARIIQRYVKKQHPAIDYLVKKMFNELNVYGGENYTRCYKEVCCNAR